MIFAVRGWLLIMALALAASGAAFAHKLNNIKIPDSTQLAIWATTGCDREIFTYKDLSDDSPAYKSMNMRVYKGSSIIHRINKLLEGLTSRAMRFTMLWVAPASSAGSATWAGFEVHDHTPVEDKTLLGVWQPAITQQRPDGTPASDRYSDADYTELLKQISALPGVQAYKGTIDTATGKLRIVALSGELRSPLSKAELALPALTPSHRRPGLQRQASYSSAGTLPSCSYSRHSQRPVTAATGFGSTATSYGSGSSRFSASDVESVYGARWYVGDCSVANTVSSSGCFHRDRPRRSYQENVAHWNTGRLPDVPTPPLPSENNALVSRKNMSWSKSP